VNSDSKRHHIQSRRDFLKIAGASALTAGLTTSVPSWGEPAAIKSTVGIAKSPSIATAVRRAVEMSGGLDFIKPGQRVLIKPNQVAGVGHPATTNPEVLYEVARLVAEAGSDTIFISDRCYPGQSSTLAAKFSGHFDAAKQAEADIGSGVKVISVGLDEAEDYMKRGSPTWRAIHHPMARNFFDKDGKDVGFYLAEFLFQVDHVINVPCAKVHNQAWLTMSMKAFVGMSDPRTTRLFFHAQMGKGSEPPANRKNLVGGPYFTTLEDTTHISRSIAELNLGLTPSLNIIDGTRPIYQGSHMTGDSAKADIIIASRDRVAADVTGVALLRAVGNEERWKNVSPWDHPMIVRAGELGLGVTAREHMTVEHEGVDTIDTILDKMA